MKSNTLLTISFVALTLIVGSLVTYNIIDQHNLKQIEAKQDLRFADYYLNKQVAANFLSIITIHDDQSYQAVKGSINGSLSDTLSKETFGTEKYTGIIIPEPILRIESIKGELPKNSDNVYLYKADISLSYGNTSDPASSATMLIKVKNGVVFSVERV